MIISILGLVSFVPMVALCVRRLHDTGKGSDTLLLFFVPFVGPLIALGLLSKKGQAQDNQYGSALQHIVIDKRLASIMKVSPTSSSLTTKVFIAVIVSRSRVCGLSMRYMAPSG